MIIDPYTWHSLPITAITPLTPDIVSVSVARPGGYTFQAGQYAIIRANVGQSLLMRQYSFASAPQSDQLEFIIQKEPGGAVSNWFHDTAQKGHHIEISQPFGGFVIDNYQQPLVMIAGRAGIAPFLSMVRDQALIESDLTPHILYSARGENDFCYSELLREGGASFFDTANHGRLATSDLQAYVHPSSRFYLCGSKRFVDAIELILNELNVAQSNVKRERFTLQ